MILFSLLKSHTIISSPLSLFSFHKRFMFNSRCLYAARTAYHCLKIITEPTMLDKISSENHTAFNKELGLFALNTTLGTPQHKKAILGHMLNYPMNAKTMYDLSKYATKIITNEPIGPSAHILTELPVCEAFLDRYSSDVLSVTITSDTIPLIVDGQKQTNFDYLTKITTNLDRMLGLSQRPETLTRIQDCKDGSSIFKHSTRGSMGIVTFDKNGKNIQTTPYPILETDLKLFNENRLKYLSIYLKRNQLLSYFSNSINQCYKELNSTKSIFDINLAIENILWHDIQRHPKFPRSISFVFLQKVDFVTNSSNFEQSLINSLSSLRDANKPYSLDKKGDAKEFYAILLKTYYKEVDKNIYKNLLFLQQFGIKFNSTFNEVLTSCIKELC